MRGPWVNRYRGLSGLLFVVGLGLLLSGCGLFGSRVEEGAGEGFDLSRPPASDPVIIPTLPRPLRRILPGGLVMMAIPGGEPGALGLQLQVDLGRRHGPRLAYALMHAISLAEGPAGGRIGGEIDVGYDRSTLWLTPKSQQLPDLIKALGVALKTVPGPEREALATAMALASLKVESSSPELATLHGLHQAFLSSKDPAFGGSLSLAYQQVLVPNRLRAFVMGPGVSEDELDQLALAFEGLRPKGREVQGRTLQSGGGGIFVLGGDIKPWVTACVGHLGSSPQDEGWLAEEALVDFLVGSRLPEALGTVGSPPRSPILSSNLSPLADRALFHLCLEVPKHELPTLVESTRSALANLRELPLSAAEMIQLRQGRGARYLSQFTGLRALGKVFGEKSAVGRPGTNPQSYMAALQALTPADIKGAAQRLFSEEGQAWAVQGNIKDLQSAYGSLTLRPLPAATPRAKDISLPQ